uniref:Uncharacterized protein n=1 Tax=Rhizophora mucronata TaxID=61149 RepID=A0A2P2K3J9_RHIMU
MFSKTLATSTKGRHETGANHLDCQSGCS